MKIQFPIEETIQKRYSVRNYSNQEITPEIIQAIHEFIDSLNNPFDETVNFHFLEKADAQQTRKLGTYGVIRGAQHYIGTTIKPKDVALLALGYELEMAILYLTHLGLGTCWLGGTFAHKDFERAMTIPDDEIFPVVTPYGYAADKQHGLERVMRKVIQADRRKDWSRLFFLNDFQTPLSREAAGDYVFPLAMLRLAPSASNKQPWRVLIKDNQCHFYVLHEPAYSRQFSYDIQKIDMGIAAAHFDCALSYCSMQGRFDTACEPELTPPERMTYVFSWIR